MSMTTVADPHVQLRALYTTLLTHQEYFDEFKRLLSLYVVDPTATSESEEAAHARNRLNERVREWTGTSEFDGLTVQQIIAWRAIVVEERINVALSPWKESNAY